MIETKIYNPPISLLTRNLSNHGRMELSRLLAAAVINPGFCLLLLEDPEMALEAGFQGETFSFTKEERDLIQSIQADSLAGLAGQLVRTFGDHLHIPVNHPVQVPVLAGY
jgi:hypothetical protein